MENFLEAMDLCAENRNWYGALFIALSLPDICGKIDNPGLRSSKERYCLWFFEYVAPAYGRSLSSADCYALRCSYLHEGTDEITSQNAREMVKGFRFIAPPPGSNSMHCNRVDNVLQLQIDIFCGDIKYGVLTWLKRIEGDRNKTEAILNLMTIKFYDDGEPIGILASDYK